MNNIIDREFKTAIADGVFPAADLLVAREGEILYSAQYGYARVQTCFDIASLTKPVATATLAMIIAAEGLLKLTDSVYQWLGGARQLAHRQMTVHHLLNHTSGLPAWQPYYRELPLSLVGTEAGKRLILDACYNEPLLSEPGEKTLYSDIGYILLGEIVEQASESKLDALFMQRIAKPLGLADTFFMRSLGSPVLSKSRRTTTSADQHVPTGLQSPMGMVRGRAGSPPDFSERRIHSARANRRFAPTEDCPWRERVIHGEVHDQNAYALGGVAGHAGLFSTSLDLHRFTSTLVNAYQTNSDWVPRDVVHEFLMEGRTKPTDDEYVLGWMRPSKKNSSSGHHFSANSIGHLGYTGCSIWIDLKENFWIILLTNRIHPASTNQKIKSFRPNIHDLIYKELIEKR